MPIVLSSLLQSRLLELRAKLIKKSELTKRRVLFLLTQMDHYTDFIHGGSEFDASRYVI